MKFKTILLTVALCYLYDSYSQSYGFMKTTTTYTNLVNGSPVNDSVNWQDIDTTISVGFPFLFFGNTYYNLDFGGMYASTISPTPAVSGAIYPLISISRARLVDRYRVFSSGPSFSPISYKTEGAIGNRIFKLEWRNAGFYDEFTSRFTTYDYINMQLWIYEATGNIEYHFGPNSISWGPIVYEDSLGAHHSLIPTLLLSDGSMSPNSISLIGNADNPNAIKGPQYRKVDGTPSNGTVYRFINGGTVSLKEFNENKEKLLSIYPNPATNSISLSIDQNELISNVVSIYNTSGKLISIRGFESNISINELDQGIYFIEATTNNGKVIGKFIKQ